jgi:hypothetical protein
VHRELRLDEVILRSVPASPYIVRETGLQVGVGKEYQSSTSRRPLHSAERVQSPNRVLLLCCPCASRLQVPCSASRVVPGAHRVVDPGTHRGSGPREVHTTLLPFFDHDRPSTSSSTRSMKCLGVAAVLNSCHVPRRQDRCTDNRPGRKDPMSGSATSARPHLPHRHPLHHR